MKSTALKMAYVALSCICAMSCTTSELVQDKASNVEEETQAREVTLSFQIMQNSYTRATDDEIENLYLAFYNIEGETATLIEVKEVTKDESGNYSTTFNLLETVPNAVIAYANVTDDSILENALTANPTIENLENDGYMVMSSASYFEDENNSLIYYSNISSGNLYNNEPVEIYLERLAAKVTVTNNISDPIYITMNGGSVNSDDDGYVTLSLSLTGWDLFGTDQSTYLLKNTDSYANLSNDITGTWWDNSSDHTLNWAQSVNWSLASSKYPAIGSEESATNTYHPKFSEIENTFDSDVLYHETTRSSSMYETPNAIPSIVLAGQCKIKGESAQTLYRRGSTVLTKEELIAYFANINKQLRILKYYYVFSSTKYIFEYGSGNILQNLDDFLFIKSPDNYTGNPNMVTLQVSLEEEDNKKLCNDNYSAVTLAQIPAINEQLEEEMGLWEVYEDGYCFFHIPVEHLGKTYDSDGTQTGSYGLVRNHHYNISLKSIESMGIGIPSTETYVGEWEYQNYDKIDLTKEVNYSVSVNKWVDVNQDVNITNK